MPVTQSVAFWPDVVNVTLLAGLAIALAWISWGKWPDPLIDFGRELYLPWRITQGAVLFKDEMHLYGPLSPYLNSLFFRIGGAGLSTLTIANALIYSTILGLLYYLVRAAWGRWAAFASCAFFVGVFSFSHLVGTDNYNFLTPYSHEMTHGTLLVLCLVFVSRQAVKDQRPIYVAAAGLLAGMSLLLKPEIIFAAGAVTFGAALLILWRDFGDRPRGRLGLTAGVFIAAAFLPMIGSAFLFWLRGGMSAGEAMRATNTAWLNVLRAAVLTRDPFQLAALGLDHPWLNLGNEVIWGGAAVVFAGLLAWGIGFFRRTAKRQKVLLCVLLLVAAAGATRVPWMNIGYALPGILLCGAIIEIVQAKRSGDDSWTVRVLLWMAAAAMLARMALSPRIFHYGFVQAALAGVVAVAILIASIPRFLNVDSTARKWHQALLTLLVAAIIGVAISNSMFFYSYHTLSIGEGADQFYGFDQSVAPTGLLVEQARLFLAKDALENNVHSLLVLPEGVMLNYLTRLPNTISYYFFAPFVLADGRNEEILQRLNAAPPDRIAVITRDMREFGVGRFGESIEHGKNLIEFINQHYQAVYQFGSNDPLDPDQFGVLILAHKQ